MSSSGKVLRIHTPDYTNLVRMMAATPNSGSSSGVIDTYDSDFELTPTSITTATISGTWTTGVGATNPSIYPHGTFTLTKI